MVELRRRWCHLHITCGNPGSGLARQCSRIVGSAVSDSIVPLASASELLMLGISQPDRRRKRTFCAQSKHCLALNHRLQVDLCVGRKRITCALEVYDDCVYVRFLIVYLTIRHLSSDCRAFGLSNKFGVFWGQCVVRAAAVIDLWFVRQKHTL